MKSKARLAAAVCLVTGVSALGSDNHDAHGRPLAGRIVYRIPTLAQGLPARSK